MLETKNYKFKKLELSDSPPDITVLNANWDLIDQLIAARIEKAMIANNLVTTSPGLVLDARQGKELKEQIDTINDSLANLLKCIQISSGTIFDFVKAATNYKRGFLVGTYLPSDLPIAVEGFIDVMVDASTARKICIFTPYDAVRPIYYRTFFNGNWYGEWGTR